MYIYYIIYILYMIYISHKKEMMVKMGNPSTSLLGGADR